MEVNQVKVLVVEDSTTMRDLITACLRDIGIKTIYPAGNGKQALSYANQVDLVVSDWDMPEMNGLELLKAVRSRPDSTGLPFLMLTAVANKEQVGLAIQAGVTDYLSKPFQPKQLTDRVTRMMSKSRKPVETNPGFEDLTNM